MPQSEQLCKLLTLVPELDGAGTAQLDLYLELATCQISEAAFKEKYDLAVALLAAHYQAALKQSEDCGAGATGAITSRKEGDLQVNFAASPFADEAIGTTAFGVQYLELRKACVATFGNWAALGGPITDCGCGRR